MSKRDEIAELLMTQDASRWDQMPAPSNLEDRRPYDPLEAYVTPQPVRLPASYRLQDLTPDEQREAIGAIAGDSALSRRTPMPPGPMPPALDQIADVERYAASLQGAPPAPEYFAGAPGDPAMSGGARLDRGLRTLQLVDWLNKGNVPRVSRGHLEYLNAAPVGAKLVAGDPPNPYVRRKPGERPGERQ